MVLAFAGDSTITKFFCIKERFQLIRNYLSGSSTSQKKEGLNPIIHQFTAVKTAQN